MNVLSHHNQEIQIAALYAGKNGRRLIERAPGIFQSVRENIEEVMWEKYPTVMLNYLSILDDY